MQLSPRLRAYAQLVRLPNVFTAFADICLGALVADALAEHGPAFLLLLPASGCLYCGGMVWNDYFDREQDRRERPFRPIPAGRVTPREAAVLGGALLGAGLLFAALAGWVTASALPVVLAGLLIGAIFLYDAWLKRTWAGPLGMGACRFLNVLLGLAPAGNLDGPGRVHLALVVGLYIVGVTWFARTEARLSSQRALAGAALLMLLSLLLALPLPVRLGSANSSPLFPYLLVVLGFLVGLPAVRAIRKPTPPLVQAAVKRALGGLVVLDAVLAAGLAGTVGLVILVLLLPVLYLGRWIYQT
jgi:4-hydroxybenzoate polyprenyltransferase